MSGGRAAGWLRLIAGGSQGPLDRLALHALWSLSVVYGGALNVRSAAYRMGIARRVRLPALVVSIGNITVGGTGKTTASVAVARWLSEHGKRVAVLSRGYRGSGESDATVVSEGSGPLVGVDVAGDEPYLLAKELPGVCVLVGKDRRRTGKVAVERLGVEAIVLDDGFQYQRLVKDAEIALVDALVPFGYDFLVPRGMLREPPRSLTRADAIWITHSDLVRESDLEALRTKIESHAPHARVCEVRHMPVGLANALNGETLESDSLRGRRVVAWSSVGNPAAFERTLEQMGAVVVGRARFPDHHAYRPAEVKELLASQVGSAEMIVTTEKDAVRLPAGSVDERVWVLRIELAGRAGAPPLAEGLDWLLAAKAAT